MKRRDALKTLGILAGSAYASRLLSACGDNKPGTGQIDTVIFMMMENRSYDHCFGSRAFDGLPGNGLVAGMSNRNGAGEDVGIYPLAVEDMCIANDPPHGFSASRLQLGEQANDGFVVAHEQSHGVGAIEPMSYLVREHIPVLHALADQYTSCDRWFSSMLGPTLPNRMYWHAGTSNGATNNMQVLDGAFAEVPTLYHQLESAGVDWAYYFGDVPVLAVLENLSLDGHLRRFNNEFFKDAADGTLPPVCYIDPSFSANDDHPPHHPLLGQQLIAATYQALATSPQWERCMLVITYDENGGFFDHVPPPTARDIRASEGFGQLGFRVPALVIGPYAKQGYISSVQYEHTSAIKHVQQMFELPDLTLRSAAANDLSDCIDFERLAAGDPADPIVLPQVDVDPAILENCSGASFREFDHDILAWADQNPEKLGAYDARSEVPGNIRAIAEYLRASWPGHHKG